MRTDNSQQETEKRQQKQNKIEQGIKDFFSKNEKLLLATQLYLFFQDRRQTPKLEDVIKDFKNNVKNIANRRKFEGKGTLIRQLDLISATIVNELSAEREIFFRECVINNLVKLGPALFRSKKDRSKIVSDITGINWVGKKYYRNYVVSKELSEKIANISMMEGLEL